jgi:hypothetical protein
MSLEAPVRNHLLSAHESLEAAAAQLLSALEAGDGEQAAKLWTTLSSLVTSHLDVEDEHLLPALLQWSERDARVLVHEHRHLRMRLEELAPRATAFAVRGFVEELRAHQRSEDRLLRQFADAGERSSSRELTSSSTLTGFVRYR